MERYFDRSGSLITVFDYARLFESVMYRKVAYDEIGMYVISTVWLGVNHNWSNNGEPLIFETMIFRIDHGSIDWSGEHTMRYSTEEQAKQGHATAVAAAIVNNEAVQARTK